jgi:hypothetical protein
MPQSTPSQKLKKLDKLERAIKGDVVSVFEHIDDVESSLNSEVEQIHSKIDNLDIPERLTEQDLVSIIEPLIPEPLKGDKGDSYVLTSQDKEEIVSKIKVPVVEKVIERIELKREEIDTDKIASDASILAFKAMQDSIPSKESIATEITTQGENVRDSLELLQDENRLDRKAIKGLDDYEEISELARTKSNNGMRGGKGLFSQMNDVSITNPINGQVPKYNATTGKWENGNDTGSTSFITLTDTPSSYSGQAGKFPKVKATEDGLEFATVSVSTPSLQQVTDIGASTTVESTFSGGTISNKVKANSSAGFLIEANNGTDVGLLGVGNTANVSWYGNHNYTGRLYAQRDAGGATPVEGMVVDNTTNATGSVLQASPSFLRRGRGFLSNSSASYPFETQDYAIGEVGLTAYGKWIHQFKANNGSWQEFMRFDSAPLGQGFSITPGQALSNGTPGTTRNMTINNTGSHSWIDFVFSGTRKSHIGASSGGGMRFFAGGDSYFEYYQMSGNSLFSYNYPTAFVHSASGFFGGSLHVGATSTPTSTFQNEGGTSLKVAYSNVNLTLDDSATQWILEPSTASCVGTPTYTCSHWTNETDCLLRDAHGGCSWFAGNPCSIYDNESGMTTCAGTSGCTVVTASCSGAGDESSCTSQDDAYGGSCSWSSGNDCGALGEGSCAGTSGCSANYSDCSTFPDEGSCIAVSGCSWDGMSCSGTYFSSCSGTYYTCDGTYNTGSCTGTYGASCTGTSVCAGIDDSTSCGGEGGCTWSTSITATLPNGDSFPSRTLWVYKKGASGTVVLTPNAGQTVNFASTYTMSSDKEWIHLAYYNLTANCNVYDGNESTCGSTSGCTQNYSFCWWDSGMSSCNGNAVCTGIGDESTCTSTSWFSSCTGTYSLSKNWYKFGS